MSTETTHAHAQEHDHSKTYLRILFALLFLTGLTVAAAYIDFGSGNIVIALTIATIKASLVALFFMHLLYEKSVNAVIACAGFLFLGIFLSFCLIDFDSRVNFQPVNVHAPIEAPAPVAAAPPAASEARH